MAWWRFKRQVPKVSNPELSETLGRAIAVVNIILIELKTGTEKLGYDNPLKFVEKTRGRSDALKLMDLMKQIGGFQKGKVDNVIEAIEIADNVATIMWGELGRASEALGMPNNAFDLVKANNGEAYAVSLVQKAAELFSRYLENKEKRERESLEPHTKEVKELFFVLGPPGPQEMKDDIKLRAEKVGKSPDKVWVDVIHETVRGILEKEGDRRSLFDDLFSDMLKINISLPKPFLTYQFEDNTYYPGLIINVDKITCLDSNSELLNSAIIENSGNLGNSFGYLFKTDWVRVMKVYKD